MLTYSSRRTFLASIASLTVGAKSSAVFAQTKFPSRTISIIAGSTAGSQSDVFARALAASFQNYFGANVIVENKPGAGGIIAAQAAVRAEPDGHTVILGSNSPFVVAPHLRDPVPYNTPKDLAPVALFMNGPSAIAVRNEFPAKTVEELVAYLKGNPGRHNFGSHGIGSFSHVAMELFMGETGTQMVHVPYNGSAPLSVAFLRGDVDVVCFDILSVFPHVQSCKARVIAQVGEQRSPLFPDIPLVSDTVPSVKADYWFGVFAPAATPRPIVEQLHRACTAALSAAEIRNLIQRASMIPGGLSEMEFADKVQRDWNQWGQIIRDRRIVSP